MTPRTSRSVDKTALTEGVKLRNVTINDVSAFFEMQSDSDANHMAAFTAKDPTDWTAFSAHWDRILYDDTITKMTVLFEEQVAGQVMSFPRQGRPEVCYWIEKSLWGK